MNEKRSHNSWVRSAYGITNRRINCSVKSVAISSLCIARKPLNAIIGCLSARTLNRAIISHLISRHFGRCWSCKLSWVSVSFGRSVGRSVCLSVGRSVGRNIVQKIRVCVSWSLCKYYTRKCLWKLRSYKLCLGNNAVKPNTVN